MLTAIDAREDHAATRQKAEQVAAKLKGMKSADAGALVAAGIEEDAVRLHLPEGHRRCL